MPSATACGFTRDPSPSNPSEQKRCSRNAAESSDVARFVRPRLLLPSPSSSRSSWDRTKSYTIYIKPKTGSRRGGGRSQTLAFRECYTVHPASIGIAEEKEAEPSADTVRPQHVVLRDLWNTEDGWGGDALE